MSESKKSLPSMTLDDLNTALAAKGTDPKELRKLELEYHRRWSVSAACLIFALLGVGLGTVTNRRSSRGGGFVICLGLLIAYWVCYVGADNVAQNGWLPASVALWLVNGVFLLVALRSLK